MDWFHRLTGFRETDYAGTRAKLAVEGDRLKSLVNGNSYGIGKLELPSLQALRDGVKSGGALSGRLKVTLVQGDVREMHRSREYAGALFQVASQFNLLEMTSYNVTPEQGVTRYEHDRTQGPACAIAAGAATIYRNYFAPVAGHPGQTMTRQLDALADLGAALSSALKVPVDRLWKMQNGYALCTRPGLDMIGRYLDKLPESDRDHLRGRLSIGLHWDVEVTEAVGNKRPFVSQVFCSALPVAYTAVPSALWKPFASLVLEAAYEATLWAAVLNAQRGTSNVVLLTSLGGGAFGNDEIWIEAAMRRALDMAAEVDLDVRLVSHRAPSLRFVQLAEDFGSPGGFCSEIR
ncbi:MAG: hypothetical protein J2P54_00860 [Bradyrhizobiaceae bacterium]|nr:hypothetical protein [Bradyrhizobiaceae bacterium]